jgi:hypothetical protein
MTLQHMTIITLTLGLMDFLPLPNRPFWWGRPHTFRGAGVVGIINPPDDRDAGVRD